MKKKLLTAMAVFAFTISNAQEQTSNAQNQIAKGKWLVEVNTGFGSGVGSTSFGLTSSDGDTVYNIGAEGGYFLIDNLALKLGLGFGDDSSKSVFSYKVGGKYYVVGKFPVEVSYNGVSYEGAGKNPSYVGMQAGYALFLGNNVSVEPGVRYNVSTNDYYGNDFQFNVGFALHF